MDGPDREAQHTSEIRRSQAEAERVMEVLQQRGWTVYPEKVPLQGQSGYYCVRTIHHPDGRCEERAHSVRWNMFADALVPLTIWCGGDIDLLSFIWQHARHDGFDYFHYGEGEGDVGFVCYCRAGRGYSTVLRVSSDGVTYSDRAIDTLVAFDEEHEG